MRPGRGGGPKPRGRCPGGGYPRAVPSRVPRARVYRSFLATRYLLTRPVNLISIGGVMLGVAVLITVTSVMDGFQERVRAVVRGNLSHLSVMPVTREVPEAALVAAQVQHADPRIMGVAAMVTAPMVYVYHDRRRGALSVLDKSLFIMTGVGLDWADEARIEQARVARGGRGAAEGGFRILASVDPVDPFASPRAQRVERVPVLASASFLRTFRGLDATDPAQLRAVLETDLQVTTIVEDREPGGEATIRREDRNFVIAGVYDGGDQAEDRARLLFRRADLVGVAGLRTPWHELRVWVQDYEQAAAVKAGLAARFPDLSIETWEDQRADFLRAVKTEKVLLVIVLSFIVLLGGFTILATLTLIVVEKTRDIGVLAALGATRGGILSIFLRNGLLVGLLGAALGLCLGAVLVANLDNIKRFFETQGVKLFPADIYLFNEIPTVWSWPTVGLIMAGSVLVAFLAGLLPALRAARLDPIAALRHE